MIPLTLSFDCLPHTKEPSRFQVRVKNGFALHGKLYIKKLRCISHQEEMYLFN